MKIFKDRMERPLTLSQAFGKILNRFYNCWLDFQLMLLRWVGHIPIHTVRKFFYRLAGVKIGKGTTIYMWANFFQPKNIKLGEDTVIGDHAFLDGRAHL
ncbi:MAG: hypothetical protein WBE27_02705, partial [Microgenomates group bacterium]